MEPSSGRTNALPVCPAPQSVPSVPHGSATPVPCQPSALTQPSCSDLALLSFIIPLSISVPSLAVAAGPSCLHRALGSTCPAWCQGCHAQGSTSSGALWGARPSPGTCSRVRAHDSPLAPPCQ